MRTEDLPRAWLSQMIDLAELRRHAPQGAAPATQRREWFGFLEQHEGRDEIWAYHACYAEHLAALTSPWLNGWAGFALVRAGKIVAHYAF